MRTEWNVPERLQAETAVELDALLPPSLTVLSRENCNYEHYT